MSGLGSLQLLWFAGLLTITLSDCPFPKKKFPNGHFVYESSSHRNRTRATENYLLRFSCSVGHTMKGPKAILCADGQWTDRVPACIKMQCESPPSIENGSYELKSGVNKSPTIGSTAAYFCDDDYHFGNMSDSTLTCHLYTDTNKAAWKGTVPSCIKKESCPDPEVSIDGTRFGDCCYTGDVLQFSCKEDFTLYGEDTIVCLSGGSWSSPRPLCKPVDDHCELPPPITNGVARGEKDGDFYRPYDEVEVLCKPGHRYSGSTGFIMCEEENRWEEEFGECKEVSCDPPEPLENGTIPEVESSNMTSFLFNFELTYICDKGFRLIGDSWRFCDTRGWSGQKPHCEVVKCPDPLTPEHGSRIIGGFGIGDKVIFKCFTGYERIGSFERYCMPNGQWSGELARCDHQNNYCPDPGIPINGNKNSSNYDMGDMVGFRCHSGYTLLGSEVRECLYNRTWSGTETLCIGPYEFDNTAKVGEILKISIAEKEEEQRRKLLEYQRALFASWHNGTKGPVGRILDINFPGRLIFYFVFDVSGSVKAHNFRKSVDFAKAIVKKVGISENGARAGAVTFSSHAETQFLPLDHTTTKSVLDAFDRLPYTGGGTSATSAMTLLREELIPLTQAVLTKKGQKSVIFILTDGRANMGGDPQEEAEKLKTEVGAEIYCIGITNTVMQDSLYKIASDPKEEHVFILQNYATLSYLIQEITNGTIDYSQCGLGLDRLGRQASKGRIAGGRKASEPWPWMAALFYFDGPRSQADLQCGGSVISDKYILTAAHCLFYTKNATLRSERDIIVKLGLTNVQNETFLQEFEVERLIPHPQYRAGPIYDYDIALLQLKRPIEFSALVRPICLPPNELPNKTTLYKPGEYSLATGWGHAGTVQKVQQVNFKNEDDLKEVILPIQTNTRCRRSVLENNLSEKVFTDRMFCVGDGTGGNDTCRGDSGGPLMQSQQNEEGYTYWIQVGIVSWGIGCGLPNTYGYYTHVQRLHSWMSSIMNAPKT